MPLQSCWNMSNVFFTKYGDVRALFLNKNCVWLLIPISLGKFGFRVEIHEEGDLVSGIHEEKELFEKWNIPKKSVHPLLRSCIVLTK